MTITIDCLAIYNERAALPYNSATHSRVSYWPVEPWAIVRKTRTARNTAHGSSRERLLDAAKTLFAEGGYDATSTASISAHAETSESQLIKHFGSKFGILQAIFQQAWEQINPAIQLATESVSSPAERLRIALEMMLNFLAKDHRLRALFLMEGRRPRSDGRLVVFVPGFIKFVGIVDGILKQLKASGAMVAGLNTQALRSALMGAIEGMLRDQMLADSSKFPARYSDADVRAICSVLLAATLKKI